MTGKAAVQWSAEADSSREARNTIPRGSGWPGAQRGQLLWCTTQTCAGNLLGCLVMSTGGEEGRAPTKLSNSQEHTHQPETGPQGERPHTELLIGLPHSSHSMAVSGRAGSAQGSAGRGRQQAERGEQARARRGQKWATPGGPLKGQLARLLASCSLPINLPAIQPARPARQAHPTLSRQHPQREHPRWQP